MDNSIWPALPLAEWQDTYATLHMWTQIVGKIRLAKAPLVNHWWNVPLYVSTCGLTTSPIPYKDASFQIDFDFIAHKLVIQGLDGKSETLSLVPRSVAEFYKEVMRMLGDLGIEVKIWPMPVEVPDPVRFDQDFKHASYDPEYVNRLWRILRSAEKVFTNFRGGFVGKCSPVHFFWGSFDLAVTRFSGRRAPQAAGVDPITREAYFHEVISHGFWPGTLVAGPDETPNPQGSIHAPAFYSYTAPPPAGLDQAVILPPKAFFSQDLKEFVLLYDEVRTSASPEDALMQFLESSYSAGADLAKWDRDELERKAQS